MNGRSAALPPAFKPRRPHYNPEAAETVREHIRHMKQLLKKPLNPDTEREVTYELNSSERMLRRLTTRRPTRKDALRQLSEAVEVEKERARICEEKRILNLVKATEGLLTEKEVRAAWEKAA